MTLVQNKKIHFNYEVLERYEAGIELLGCEVKSIRAGRVSFDGSHITVCGGEAYLIGATIQPYQASNLAKNYDANRNKRLLLTKNEIAELSAQESKKGLTIVPVSMYNKGRKVKVEIAIVRGKKNHDKRETLKKRESERDIMRDIKSVR